MNITIRPAKASDAARCEEIHAAGWEYAYRGILDDDFLDATKEKFLTNAWIARTAEWLSDSDGVSLVAINSDNLVVGLISGNRPSSADDKETFKMDGLYLDPKYIGQGVGKKLFLAFVDWVRQNGGKKFVVECLAQNKSSGFYKKMGGTEFERHMYKDKYPEIIFQFVVKDINC